MRICALIRWNLPKPDIAKEQDRCGGERPDVDRRGKTRDTLERQGKLFTEYKDPVTKTRDSTDSKERLLEAWK